jgi:cold shock CspA family protein
MRTHGTLSRWNDDRGFGFITPAQGNYELFVHVSAFPRDGERPRIGEIISYETETGPNGKPRAVRVMRPGSRRRVGRVRETQGPTAAPATSAIVTLLAVIAIGAYAYSRVIEPRFARASEAAVGADPAARPIGVKCDGRTMCPQMTSCAEATYFLQHCPNPEMDGDGDGVPCEQQWCN